MKTLQDLERANPEWRAWLAVVRALLAELDDPGWDAVVPPPPRKGEGGVPLLALVDGFPAAELRRLQERLPARSVSPAAVAMLLPLPFLQACRRRWASAIPQEWAQGYCPVCGAWPSFTEVCGVERSRYRRCGRCGAGWRTQALSCTYCGTTDHGALGTLVVEARTPPASIDVCRRCLGYLKSFTRLRPGPPAEVLVEDLASVELDLAAAERGYARPERPGYALA